MKKKTLHIFDPDFARDSKFSRDTQRTAVDLNQLNLL